MPAFPITGQTLQARQVPQAAGGGGRFHQRRILLGQVHMDDGLVHLAVPALCSLLASLMSTTMSATCSIAPPARAASTAAFRARHRFIVMGDPIKLGLHLVGRWVGIRIGQRQAAAHDMAVDVGDAVQRLAQVS